MAFVFSCFAGRRNRYIESLKHLSKYDSLYDEVYAMHGSIPVAPDLVEKLIDGATRIKNGEVTGSKVRVLDGEAILYKFSYAGFLCES